MVANVDRDLSSFRIYGQYEWQTDRGNLQWRATVAGIPSRNKPLETESGLLLFLRRLVVRAAPDNRDKLADFEIIGVSDESSHDCINKKRQRSNPLERWPA